MIITKNNFYVLDFYSTNKWKILNKKLCHFYNEEETCFIAVGVEIGLKTFYISSICSMQTQQIPIIRWMTLNEYKRLTKTQELLYFE